jgi:DNA adenine methylase
MGYCFLRYIGSKNRMAGEIAKRLQGTGRDMLVDIFGGSAAVTLNAGFEKRIYNDIDGDLVNLFRVLSDDNQRRQLFKKLRWLPPSREIFENDGRKYFMGGFSFVSIKDPVDRARATFYRQSFAFGGKWRSGGFTVGSNDRRFIKEIGKYQANMRLLCRAGDFFRNTVIENLHYRELIKIYGGRTGVVFFADPPYPDIQNYYSSTMSEQDHVFLSWQLLETPAPVVATFYDTPKIRELYPEKNWKYEVFENIKNSSRTILGHHKAVVAELILTKR